MNNADSFFDGQTSNLLRGAKQIEKDIATTFYTAAMKGLSDATVTLKGNTVKVATDELKTGGQVIDMKKHFRKSPKAKLTKTGGWYLVVPIRRYAARSRKYEARGMSQRLYTQLNNAASGTKIVSDYLYDNRTKVSAVPELNPTNDKENGSINKMKNPRGRGSIYVSYRTVGSFSKPNSWIMNRDKADPEDMTRDVEQIIAATRKFINKQ